MKTSSRSGLFVKLKLVEGIHDRPIKYDFWKNKYLKKYEHCLLEVFTWLTTSFKDRSSTFWQRINITFWSCSKKSLYWLDSYASWTTNKLMVDVFTSKTEILKCLKSSSEWFLSSFSSLRTYQWCKSFHAVLTDIFFKELFFLG